MKTKKQRRQAKMEQARQRRMEKAAEKYVDTSLEAQYRIYKETFLKLQRTHLMYREYEMAGNIVPDSIKTFKVKKQRLEQLYALEGKEFPKEYGKEMARKSTEFTKKQERHLLKSIEEGIKKQDKDLAAALSKAQPFQANVEWLKANYANIMSNSGYNLVYFMTET